MIKESYIHKKWRVTVSSTIIKEAAHQLIDKMPDNSTWDDLIYEIYVRQSIESGIADSKSDAIKTASEIRNKYGLI